MPLAISYARFSSGKQQHGDSIRRQMEATRAYCAEQGLTLDETIRDLGLSAYKGEHLDKDAGLGRLIERIRSGDIPKGSVLIVEAHDRLSRLAPRLALPLFLEIMNAGVEVVTLIDKQRYSAETIDQNAGQLFVSIGMMLGSHMESRTKSERVKAARQAGRQAATEGRRIMTKTVPAWVEVIDGKLVANAGAATVRRIFQEVAAGLGTYTVAKRLNAERIPTLSGTKKSNGWNKSRILAIVRSDAPLGWMQPHIRDGERRKPIGEPIKNYYPIVVDQPLADRARQMITSRRFGGEGAGRKGEVYSNLFSGIAKCAVCGGSMFLSHRYMPRSKAGWLRCSRAGRQQDCRNLTSVPYAALERVALERINWGLALQNEIQNDPATEIRQQIAEKKSELEKLVSASSRLINEFTESPNSLVKGHIERMSKRFENLSVEINGLERKAASSVRAEISDDEWKRMLIENTQVMDKEERLSKRVKIANALRAVLDRLECSPDRSVRLFFRVWTTKLHRMQVYFGLNWNDEPVDLTDEAACQRFFPTMRIEVEGKSDDIFLGVLAPALVLLRILKAENEGKTFFDLVDVEATRKIATD